jgi:hypothetical protein
MLIQKLKKEVNDTGALLIKVGDNVPFSINSEEYEEKQEWFIKGGYSIVPSFTQNNLQPRTLLCARLEKDITISINRPLVNGEKLPANSEEIGSKLEVEQLDSLISAVFFDKKTLEMAGKEIRIRDILPYSEACVESFKKRFPDREVDLNDFAIVTIDWKKKNIQIRPV